MTHPGGRPPKYNNCLDLEFFCDLYFESCEELKQHPTISGLALSLNMSRRSITNYKNRDEFLPTIKKARLYVESYLEQMLFGNSVTGIIFNLKNNFDWKDKTELEHTGDAFRDKSDEELENRRKELESKLNADNS